MSSDRPPGGVRFAWACIALSLAGCSGETVDLLPDPQSSAGVGDAIVWQEGSGGTRTFLGPGQVIRCWHLNNTFDCLYADVFDLRQEIADAPVRRAYYRFLTSRLPDRMGQLDGLDISDGYECSTSNSRDRSSLLEAIWKNGRIVAQSSINQQMSSEVVWKPEQIATLFQEHAVAPRRPAFACSLVDEIATKMGLEALDSPLVSYEALVQANRPADGAQANEAPVAEPSSQP